MRTLKGYEAIQVAEQFNIMLNDLENRTEVSAEEAREYIERRRDPSVLAIPNWPDTEEEAERIVLQEYQSALADRRVAEARIFDLSIHLSGGLPIHPVAAEMAAERLVERNKLEYVKMREDEPVYRIPQSMYFKRSFLDRLRKKVCPDCAHLDPEGAFHEICLMNLVSFIQEMDLSSADIVEVRPFKPSDGRQARNIHPSMGIQWLSKRASATKQRVQSVLKPIFSQEKQNLSTPETREFGPKAGHPAPPPPVAHAEQDGRHVPNPIPGERTKISKEALIGYLRSVEIIEENGELSELRREKDALLAQIAAREHEMEKIQKQRLHAEKQFEEVQRDMDVMVEALQIAKRRTPNSVHVIDATYANSKDEA